MSRTEILQISSSARAPSFRDMNMKTSHPHRTQRKTCVAKGTICPRASSARSCFFSLLPPVCTLHHWPLSCVFQVPPHVLLLPSSSERSALLKGRLPRAPASRDKSPNSLPSSASSVPCKPCSYRCKDHLSALPVLHPCPAPST